MGLLGGGEVREKVEGGSRGKEEREESCSARVIREDVVSFKERRYFRDNFMNFLASFRKRSSFLCVSERGVVESSLGKGACWGEKVGERVDVRLEPIIVSGCLFFPAEGRGCGGEGVRKGRWR